MTRVTWLTFTAALLSLPAAAAPDPPAGPKVGDRAPAVLGVAIDGDAAAVRPREWAGRHTLLVFWSPADPASVRQLGELRRVHREFGGTDRFEIVGVATVPAGTRALPDGWNAWIDFLGDQPDVAGPGGKRQPFPSAWVQLFEAERFSPKDFPPDAGGRTTTGRYAATDLPAAFLVGPDGRLAAVRIPAGQWRAAVAAALAGGRAEGPGPGRMQELFDLTARQTKLRLELRQVEARLAELEKAAFAGFDRVADPTGTEYWESVGDTVLTAKATADIRAGELLLYHAPGIYRVKDVRPKLTTEGECWYFRPDRAVRNGEAFAVVRVYDAPEEVKLKAAGRFPQTDRARDPDRAYTAEVHIAGRPRKR